MVSLESDFTLTGQKKKRLILRDCNAVLFILHVFVGNVLIIFLLRILTSLGPNEASVTSLLLEFSVAFFARVKVP